MSAGVVLHSNMGHIAYRDREELIKLVEKYGENKLLNEGLNKKALASLIGAGVLAGSTLLNNRGGNEVEHKDNKTEYYDTVKYAPNNPYGINNIDYDNIKKKQKLVKEYIADILSKHNKTLDSLRFNPDNLVLNAYLYDFDLPFMLAQLQIESHFGTTDRARKSNSIFSVGAYDSGKDVVKFRNQDESIPHYIKTVQKDYLLDGDKDIYNLLHNYVNYDGKRYASNPNYEEDLRRTRDSILRKYPELENDYECFM